MIPMATIKMERKSSFITEYANKFPGIVCPGFWVAAAASGCRSDCYYCYLNRTLRRGDGGKRINIQWSNLDKLEREVVAWFKAKEPGAAPRVLNIGETCDSLGMDEREDSYIKRLHGLFSAGLTNDILLIVTKSARLGVLKDLYPHRNVIVSFTINTEAHRQKWEIDTDEITRRFWAAQELIEKKWRVRLRLDPLSSDEASLQDLLRRVRILKPERVTLGTWRFFEADREYAPDLFTDSLVKDGDDDRFRMNRDQRVAIYRTMMKYLSEYNTEVGLCRETRSVFDELRPGRCNCEP